MADLAIALSTIIFWAVEIEKWLARRKHSRQGFDTEGCAMSSPVNYLDKPGEKAN